MKFNKKYLFIIVLIVFAIIAYLGYAFFPETKSYLLPDSLQKQKILQSVVVQHPIRLSDKRFISFPGYVQPSRKAVLFFRVSGPIIDVNIKPGDEVKKGKVLMKIDQRDYKKNIDYLEFQLKAEKAHLEKAKFGYNRYKRLEEKNAVSKEKYELKIEEYFVAKSNIEALETKLKIAKDQLDDTELIAPFDGIIKKQFLEKHEMAYQGEPVLSMYDISVLEVVVSVSERDINKILKNRNGRFVVIFGSLCNETFPAKLYEWSPDTTETIRTYELVLRLGHLPDKMILPGMTAEVIYQHTKNSLNQKYTIPLNAIVSKHNNIGKLWIFNSKANTVSSNEVELGDYYKNNLIEVVSGLEGNELIVTDGAHFMHEGLKVIPINIGKK